MGLWIDSNVATPAGWSYKYAKGKHQCQRASGNYSHDELIFSITKVF